MSPEVLAILKAVGWILGGVIGLGMLSASISISYRVGVGVRSLKALEEKQDASNVRQEENNGRVAKTLEHLTALVEQHDTDIAVIKALAGRRASDRPDDRHIAR